MPTPAEMHIMAQQARDRGDHATAERLLDAASEKMDRVPVRASAQADHMSDQFDEDDDDASFAPEPPDCPTCGGPGGMLGQLGKRTHYRCRNCGSDYSTT